MAEPCSHKDFGPQHVERPEKMGINAWPLVALFAVLLVFFGVALVSFSNIDKSTKGRESAEVFRSSHTVYYAPYDRIIFDSGMAYGIGYVSFDTAQTRSIVYRSNLDGSVIYALNMGAE